MVSDATPVEQRRTALETAVATLTFPLALGAALALCAALLERGYSVGVAGGAPAVLAAIGVLGLERLFPHHRSWLHSIGGDLRVDAAHAVSVGLTGALLTPAITVGALVAADALGSATGAAAGPWPVHWSWWVQLPVALVVGELPKYWHHRLQHQTDLLWRFHATHHSVPRLYWLNAARFHPIDIGIDATLGLGTLLVLGCPPEVLALFTVLSGVHGYFQHANLQIRIGPLNYIFSMAELHRWHHSKTLEEANHNYGQNVIIWDLVFGTFFWPSDREPPEDIGIPDLPAFPMTFWRQLASPFVWRRIKERSARIAASDWPTG